MALKIAIVLSSALAGYIAGLFSTLLFFIHLRTKISLTPVILGLAVLAISYAAFFGIVKLVFRISEFRQIATDQILNWSGIPFTLAACVIGGYIFFFGKWNLD